MARALRRLECRRGAASVAGGKWNTYEITAKGRQITVVLNGQKTAELHNVPFAEGPFRLQHGEGAIKFRKVAVKSL
jgi:Domain of Unknown Function (DUF1080)